MHLWNGDYEMKWTAKHLQMISVKSAALILLVIMTSVICACSFGQGGQNGNSGGNGNDVSSGNGSAGSNGSTSGRRIVRIGHNQATDRKSVV